MSKISTSAPTFSDSLLTSDSEFDNYTENSELSPVGEKADAIITSEATPTNPPQALSRPDSFTQPFNTSPTSPTSSARNSKQNFFSLFKKKETLNNVSSSRPMSSPPQQRLASIVSTHNNKNTTEEVTTKDNTSFATDHNVSQSVIGSVSVPNLLNTDASLEVEYDTFMKKQQQAGLVTNGSDGSYSVAGGKPLNNQPKKSGKRKDSLASVDKNDDKGFKNTMKNTMRKTSTFFKKLGNKQGVDNPSQQSGRLPLPDFQDGSNSEVFRNIPSPALSTIEHEHSPEPCLDVNDGTVLSENGDNNDLDDEHVFLQRTLKDYASVYANFQTNDENRRRSGLYRLSLLGANKSVPDNIGRTFEWEGQPSNNTNNGVQLTNEDSEQEYLDKRISSGTSMSLPVMNSERQTAKSRQIPEEIPAGLEQVEEEGPEDIYMNQKNTRQNEAPLTRSPISPSSLETDRSVSGFPPSPDGSEKRSLKINTDQKGSSMKPKRSESVELGTNSGLSPSTIPKRPNKKLPDIPKIIPTPESDVSYSRSPHTRQASSNESSNGSTTTLHTAPPSPTTDAFIGYYMTDGTPKIQVDNLVDGPIRNFDDGDSPPEVPGKVEDEILWAEARISAKKCFDEDETFIKKEMITEYLGGHKLINSRTLKCYMDYFDFSNLRLDVAFRGLCGKLYIKGETQQVERILEAFSIRFWDCNPKTIYGSCDVVYAIAYSVLLLNTDLHVAQVASKMSRSQFVRNTMEAVHHARASMSAQNNNPYEDDQSTITSTETTGTSATARPRRSGSIKSWRSNPNSSLTNLSFMSGGFSRQWDSEIESLLKDMYSAIRTNQILQPVTSLIDKASSPVEPSNTLTPGLHRSMSHLGHPNSRIYALKKGRSTGNVKGRKNVEGRISPSPSVISGGSDSSIGLDSLNRSGSTQTLSTTLSSFSLRHASSSETGLNSTIPEMVDGHDPDDAAFDRVSVADSVSTTESLELYLSAPYAKEGLLVRKHYWESTNKRAKDKGWKECFVVIEKGDIKMYKFETGSSHGSTEKGAFGGGNWMANATLMDEVNLRHTITNALPPPGYNRSRPHVFALSMSNGGLCFFQAGTAELVNEWVATCNYWAARMSKEPLTGGVSNMEYGWGRCLDFGEDFEDERSVMSDGRSVMSSNSTNDRIVVSEWKTPLPPMVSSNFDEESQLAALKKYKVDLENELEKHKNFWEPMTKLFNPKSSNYTKAFSNWEKKSQWLLYEIVKYTTYIECINNSINLRAERRKEKEKSKVNEDRKTKNDDDTTNSPTQLDEEKKKEKKKSGTKKSKSKTIDKIAS